MMLGWTEILVLGAVLTIAVSFRKLPMLVKSMRASLKGFKEGLTSGDERPMKDVTPKDPEQD